MAGFGIDLKWSKHLNKTFKFQLYNKEVWNNYSNLKPNYSLENYTKSCKKFYILYIKSKTPKFLTRKRVFEYDYLRSCWCCPEVCETDALI